MKVVWNATLLQALSVCLSIGLLGSFMSDPARHDTERCGAAMQCNAFGKFRRESGNSGAATHHAVPDRRILKELLSRAAGAGIVLKCL